jgi:hypothetical protein
MFLLGKLLLLLLLLLYTNYNMRAHPGRYITAATVKAAVSPTKTFNT